MHKINYAWDSPAPSNDAACPAETPELGRLPEWDLGLRSTHVRGGVG